MELFWVRHTSVDVPKGFCYGKSEVPLRETFAKEAHNVYRQISSFTFCSVYSSPSSRCRSLACYCNFFPVLDNKLMEIDFGDWEMQKWDDIKDPHLEQWYNNWIDTPVTNGESFREMYARVSLFIEGIRSAASQRALQDESLKILIFTHAGVILCAKVYAGLISFKELFYSVPDYGSVTKITL